MRQQTKIRRGGFTLVEMMVVIAIIAILAAILVPVAGRVTRKARETRIGTELSLLSQALESYKQQFNDYPPDGTDTAVMQRHLRARFPRYKESAQVLQDFAQVKMTPAESLVFWLAQVKDDSRLPLTGQGDAKEVFTFEKTRLIPTQVITLGNTQIQLYQFNPQDARDTPYVYFDSRTYANAVYTDAGTAETVRPYQFLVPDSTGTPDWANDDTFQLISAGLDGEFGETQATALKVFPQGANYTSEDLDNITDFNDNKPLRANPDYDL